MPSKTIDTLALAALAEGPGSKLVDGGLQESPSVLCASPAKGMSGPERSRTPYGAGSHRAR